MGVLGYLHGVRSRLEVTHISLVVNMRMGLPLSEKFVRVAISEVGGLLRPGNLNGSCVRDPVAGLFIVISAPVPVPCPLGFLSTLFCEIK